MSATNLLTNETPSEDLDLNSDAVPLEDQNEIFRVGVTESSATTNASVAEILTEAGTEKVRVSVQGENPVEPQGFDVHGEAEPVCASVSQKVEDQRSGDEVVKAECSREISESVVEKIQVFVGDEVVVMDNKKVTRMKDDEVPGVDDLDGNPSCSDKNRTLEGSLTNGDLSCEENTSMQEGKTDSNPVAEDETRDFNTVEENLNEGARATVDLRSDTGMCEPDSAQLIESVEPLMVGNSDPEVQVTECHSLEEKLKVGIEVVKVGTSQVCVTVDSNSVVEVTDGSQAPGVPDSAQVTESVEPLTAGTSDPEAQVTEFQSLEEDQKDGIEVVQVGTSRVCVTVDSNSVVEVADVSQATDVCASLHREGVPDSAQVTESVEPSVIENSDPEVQVTEFHSLEERQKAGIEVVQVGTSWVCVIEDSNAVAEVTDGSQATGVPDSVHVITESVEPLEVSNLDSMVEVGECHVLENEDRKAGSVNCVTVDSNSGAEVTDGPQATSLDASVCSETEPDSAQVTESVESLEVGNPDSDVQVTEFQALEDEEQEVVKVESSPACLTINSDSVADVTDGPQTTGICAALHSEAEPDSAQVTEEPGSEVQVTECSALEDDGRESGMEVVKVGDLRTCVTVDSNLVAEDTDGSQAMGVCASLHREGVPDSAQVTKSVEPLAIGNLDSEVRVTECRVSEDEGQESGMEVVRVDDSQTCVTVDLNWIAKDTIGSQGMGVCASLHIEGMPDSAQATESVEPLVIGNLDSEVQVTECRVSEDEGQESGMEVVKVGISQACVTVDSNSDAEVTKGSQATGLDASLLSEADPDSAQVTESVESLEVRNLDSGVQVTEFHASEDEERKAGTKVVKVGSSQVCVTVDSNLAAEVTDGSQDTECLGEPDSTQVTKSVAPLIVGNPDSEVQVTEITDGSQATGVCASLYSEVELDSAQVTESVEALVVGNPDSEAHVTECHASEDDEKRKAGLEDVKVGNSQACVTVDSNSVVEVNGEPQDVDMCSSLHSKGEPDSAQDIETENVEPLVVGNLDSKVQFSECHSAEDEEQKESFAHANLSDKENSSMQDGDDIMDSRPVKENLNQGACGTIDSNSLAGVTNEFQATGSCSSLHNELEVESGSTQVAESIGPLEDGNSYSEVHVTEGHASGDEEQKTGIEVIVGVSKMKDEISGIDALDGIPSCSEKNESLDSEVFVGSIESLPDEDSSRTIAQVAETVSNQVDVDERMDLHPVVESLNEGACVTVVSTLLPEFTDGSQAMVSCVSQHGKGDEPDFSRLTESVGPLEDDVKPDSEVEVTEGQASQDEVQKGGTKVAKVECATVITESLVEQIQVVVGEEVAVMYNDEVLKMKDEVSGTDALEVNLSCVEKKQILEAEVAEGITESPPDGDLSCSRQDEKQTIVAQVAETVSNQVEEADKRTNSHLIEENLNGESEPDSARVSESVRPVEDAELDSEFKVGQGCASPQHKDQIMGTHVSEIGISTGEMNQTMKEDETEVSGGSSEQDENKIMGSHVSEVGVSQSSGKECIMGSPVEDLDSCAGKDGNLYTEDEVITEETASERGYAASYCLSPEKEGEFSISDLVWGKVRSHPWWPGQIFDSSDSSEHAMKYHKKDSFLVAYFGDQTFAWNEASSLKPLQTHFSQMEKQSSSESFRSAVGCALDEVSRRVELGMACSCTPKEDYAKVKSQIIENVGIREESRRRDGVDKSLSSTSFEPDKLVQYVKALAQNPCSGGDRLGLVIAQTQLLAFYRLKGYPRLPEFHVYGGLLENDSQANIEDSTPVSKNEERVPSGKIKLKNPHSYSRKRKNVSEDGLHRSRKERSLSELMSEEKASSYLVNGGKSDGTDERAVGKSGSSSGTKRKVTNSFSDDLEVNNKKQIVLPSRDVDTESSTPRSFKVGECIRRIASQLTGAPPILKCSRESFQNSAVKVDRSIEKTEPEELHRRRVVIPKKFSSPDEMLSQLCLAARDPMKGYSFLTTIVDFFTDFRNSVSLDRPSSRKQKKPGSRKPSNSENTFDFEDMSDSYWTDRIIQSSPEEQPSHRNMKRKGESLLEASMEMDDLFDEQENSLQLIPLLDSREQNLNGDHDLIKEKPSRKNRRRKRKSQLESQMELQILDGNLNEKSNADDFSPLVLILSFTEAGSVPSEMNLNKIFSRFGPLKESETEVMRESSSAKVVFKNRIDAEVAFSSARKFGIFGSVPVSYQLRYLSSISSKGSPCSTPQAREDAAFLEYNTT